MISLVDAALADYHDGTRIFLLFRLALPSLYGHRIRVYDLESGGELPGVFVASGPGSARTVACMWVECTGCEARLGRAKGGAE